MMKAYYKNVFPYKDDHMDLPVADVAAAVPFYTDTMNFKEVSRTGNSVILERDAIRIGLCENGGDPSQEGCVFEVDDVEAAMEELNANGLTKNASELGTEKHGETMWRVFYLLAPDGLCYCLGEKE